MSPLWELIIAIDDVYHNCSASHRWHLPFFLVSFSLLTIKKKYVFSSHHFLRRMSVSGLSLYSIKLRSPWPVKLYVLAVGHLRWNRFRLVYFYLPLLKPFDSKFRPFFRHFFIHLRCHLHDRIYSNFSMQMIFNRHAKKVCRVHQQIPNRPTLYFFWYSAPRNSRVNLEINRSQHKMYANDTEHFANSLMNLRFCFPVAKFSKQKKCFKTFFQRTRFVKKLEISLLDNF